MGTRLWEDVVNTTFLIGMGRIINFCGMRHAQTLWGSVHSEASVQVVQCWARD